MGDEFKEFENSAPTLSFDAPTAEAEAPAMQAAPAAQVDPQEAQLSEEEMKQVDAFVNQIDITNSQAVMNYGAGTQKKMADFSEKAIDNVRTKDMGQVGDMIAKRCKQGYST